MTSTERRQRPWGRLLFRLGARRPVGRQTGRHRPQASTPTAEHASAHVSGLLPQRATVVSTAADHWDELTLDSLLHRELVRLATEVMHRQDLLASSGRYADGVAYATAARGAGQVLVAVVLEYGWPTLRLVGADGCTAALQLALNVPAAAQTTLRPALSRGVARGEVPGSHLVLLDAMVAVTTGTQLRDDAPPAPARTALAPVGAAR
ncbi:hypothetical protein [Kitasatospora sp. NPDC059327]|uniref:hypothetical protein n=1 Tax=Kitasatospora sp. NPDC059327 TaxID=3346803 RepID=UPI00368ED32F